MTLLIRSTVKLGYFSGFPWDVSENVWWFNVPGVDPEAEFTAIGTALSEFYNDTWGSGPQSIGARLAESIDRDRTSLEFRVYDEATGTPVGDPNEVEFPIPAAIEGGDLPLEVALCTSFKNNDHTGPVPARRRRGRLYIGPFVNQPSVILDGINPRPTAELISSIAEASAHVRNVGLATGDFEWVIYSRAAHLAFRVNAGWVDDEFDTQRRRGQEATARVTW